MRNAEHRRKEEKGKMEEKKVMYAYIKGERYKSYFVDFEGTEEIKAIHKEFESLEVLNEFVIQFSNYYSIPIQYYI